MQQLRQAVAERFCTLQVAVIRMLAIQTTEHPQRPPRVVTTASEFTDDRKSSPPQGATDGPVVKRCEERESGCRIEEGGTTVTGVVGQFRHAFTNRSVKSCVINPRTKADEDGLIET